MLFENPEIRTRIGRMIERVSTEAAWHDDLMQEALIHLWRLEAERPQQTESWYLQSCRFHLRHYLELGRSVDSWKRNEGSVSLCLDDEEEIDLPSPRDPDGSLISEIVAHEILDLLLSRLTAPQQTVLWKLSEGLSSREIGRRLKISHKAVIKHRNRIATIARKLGIGPGTN